jgi:hypothetical protein
MREMWTNLTDNIAWIASKIMHFMHVHTERLNSGKKYLNWYFPGGMVLLYLRSEPMIVCSNPRHG